MLHINDITYRVEGRLLLDQATVMIPNGHKVGLVGRNGSGKTTLLKLIQGEIAPDSGAVSVPKAARIGSVAQEAPGDDHQLIDFVLAADAERTRLLAEAETADDPHRISEIQLRLTDIGAHEAPSRAATILAGLGFNEAAQQRPLAEFSGGWRMRVALAALLFAAPDLLLLDEPTNYLDLEGALWLETFLRRYPHTVLIVSHDRDLLNRAVQGIVHLDQRKLTSYSGGYDRFERQRREAQALQLKLKKRQDEARRHMQAFVDRFRAKATKARQAQSRIKALERMQPIPDIVENRIKPFHFPDPEKVLSPPLIRFEEASAGYGADTVVLSGLDLRLDPDDRIGLLGANGNGKSTFAKLLAGRLEPLSGHRRCDRRIGIGYFAQHQLDELAPEQSPYTHVRTLMPDATEAMVRGRVGAIGFGADTADTPAKNLSGGEKARLLFALATFHGPHLMILDEPTNHLDIESREALVLALSEYQGAVVLISHDRHLVEAVADRLWLVADGTVAPYDGDMDMYRNLLLSERRSASRGERAHSDGAAGEAGRDDQAGRRRERARRRQELAPLRREIRTQEEAIEKLRATVDTLDNRLADGALYTDQPDEAAKLARQRAETLRAIEAAESRWLVASEAFEAAKLEAD